MNFVILIPLGLVVVIVLLFIIFRIDDDSMDNFMSKVYKSAYDANKKDAMKKLKKKDSKMASDMEKVDDIISNYKKKLAKLPKEEQERRTQKAWDSID